MKNPCCSCEYRGELFYLDIDKVGIPHCHCHHETVSEEQFGWESLREAFWTCKYFKRRPRPEPKVKNLREIEQ